MREGFLTLVKPKWASVQGPFFLPFFQKKSLKFLNVRTFPEWNSTTANFSSYFRLKSISAAALELTLSCE